MLRNLRTLSGLFLGMAVAPQAWAFTIWGPLETFQTAGLSYGTRYYYSPNVSGLNQDLSVPGNVPYVEQGGPKNYGEGSRLNSAIITYGYDYTFLNFYGTEGVKAVDAAFAILNRLPTVSGASADLSEFVTEGNQQINYTARALSMLDLKSTVLQIMIEHMGLLGETHVFDLFGRQVVTGCIATYQVAVRNYDPITWNPSTYVNGTLYAYNIIDNCTIGVTPDIADAYEEASVDPGGNGISTTTSAVATAEAQQLGGFYLGLTRDDFGGLRYLYRHNNYNNEAMPSNAWVGGLTTAWSPVGATNVLDNTWTGTVGGWRRSCL